MENQHRAIKGYRDLTRDEIEAMNEAKALGAQVGELLDRIATMPCRNDIQCHLTIAQIAESNRWRAIARTDLQKGFMALIRSIALPDSFA